MHKLIKSAAVFFALTGFASASEPFTEVTVGVPVASISEAEAWYKSFLGPDTEMFSPVPGIVEFKVAPGVWLQIFEPEEGQAAGSVVRFKVANMADAQASRAAAEIDTGQAIEVPGVVTFSEFADPDGNGLGFYQLP